MLVLRLMHHVAQGLLAYEMAAMEQEDSELRTTGLYAEVHHYVREVEERRAELTTALKAAAEVLHPTPTLTTPSTKPSSPNQNPHPIRTLITPRKSQPFPAIARCLNVGSGRGPRAQTTPRTKQGGATGWYQATVERPVGTKRGARSEGQRFRVELTSQLRFSDVAPLRWPQAGEEAMAFSEQQQRDLEASALKRGMSGCIPDASRAVPPSPGKAAAEKKALQRMNSSRCGLRP